MYSYIIKGKIEKFESEGVIIHKYDDTCEIYFKNNKTGDLLKNMWNKLNQPLVYCKEKCNEQSNFNRQTYKRP